jgi:hypothetical protein
MGNALRLLFNLHAGEGRKASLFIILGLLWSVGSYGSFVLSEGMFLERVGAHALPKIYFGIACAMCLLSAILIIALNRFSLVYLFVAIIALWICVNFIFFALYPLYSLGNTYWYFYKAAGWMMPISTYIVYWAFADQYYDLQDGKRFFCLFNATTFLGDALGSALIAYALDFLGFRMLLLLFIGAMLLAIPMIFMITSRLSPFLEDQASSVDASFKLDLRGILNAVLRSKFTVYLIVFYFSMQLLAVVTEFNYMETYEKCFDNAPIHALTEFNGRCGMWISLGNMLFGMLFYSRLVKKMGINNIIVIAPSFFLAIFCFWFFRDALSLAVFGMVAREGMAYSFDDNNLNLLITGVPAKVKNQVRVSIESFIEPTGMFAAASFLLFFQNEAHLLGLTISIIALASVIFLRSSYPKAIFKNLVASSITFEKKTQDFLTEVSNKELKKTEFQLLSILKLSGEKRQLIAYEYLLKIGHLRILPRLLNQIGKLSLPGKLRAIQLLSESRWARENLVLERLEQWRRILPHPAIKSTIHFYLARHGFLRPERIMHDLNSEHLGLKAAAILTLKTSANAFQFPSFCALASEQLQQMLESKDEKEVCMALEILGLEKKSDQTETVFSFLKHPSLNVNKAAAKALSIMVKKDQKEYARRLISHIGSARDSDVKSCCLQALEELLEPSLLCPLILSTLHFRPTEFKQVERIILNLEGNFAHVLIQLVQDRKIPDRCRLLAGKILGKKDLKSLQRRLYFIVRREIQRAYFYFFHAHTVQRQVPEHDLSILQKALITSYYSITDFIIQLLGVAGSLEECEVLSHTLRSQNRKIRAQAVESLEKTCNAKLFALLEPLIDDRLPEAKLHFFLKGGGIPLNLTQLLDAMAYSPSHADQIISLAMKARLKTPDWRSTVMEKMQQSEETFHHFAEELLKGNA